MQRETRRFVILAIIFSIFAITFALLYHFKVVNYMTLYLAVTYVSYFVGIALFYNGAYTRNKDKTTSTKLNFIFGFVFIAISIALLVYGLVTKEIILF